MSIPSLTLMEVLTDLRREIRQAHRPTLEEVLEEYLPLPKSSIFFGVAEDGLPVLLDLGNAAVGALLLLGDRGSGKTHLLRTVARALIQTKDAAYVRFTVITRHPEEWEDLRKAPHCEGGVRRILRTGLSDIALFPGRPWSCRSRAQFYPGLLR